MQFLAYKVLVQQVFEAMLFQVTLLWKEKISTSKKCCFSSAVEREDADIIW